MPAIDNGRVPLLQIKKDQQFAGVAGALPLKAGSILARAGSAGTEGIGNNSGVRDSGANIDVAPLSARAYQIQRANEAASMNSLINRRGYAGTGTDYSGAITDIMASGQHANLPNWGRSVGGGVSSFSISGASSDPNPYMRGVPANNFELNQSQQQPQQPNGGPSGGPGGQLSPRSSRIARKGNQDHLRDRLYNNPLGY
jgi:hypothetical protein